MKSTPSIHPDADLVHAWLQGDPRAFERVVRPHIRPLRRHLMARFQDVGLADEAASDALLKAWIHRRRYDHRGSFRAWLFTLGRRSALDLVRARAARARLSQRLEVRAEPRTAPSPEAPMLAAERRRRVQRLLARLPERHRRVVELRFGLDMTAPEIADQLGTTPRRTRDRLAYALRCLRRRPALAA